MESTRPCTHAWQLEGVALGDDPLAWWWCACGAQAVGTLEYGTDQPGLLLPA